VIKVGDGSLLGTAKKGKILDGIRNLILHRKLVPLQREKQGGLQDEPYKDGKKNFKK